MKRKEYNKIECRTKQHRYKKQPFNRRKCMICGKIASCKKHNKKPKYETNVYVYLHQKNIMKNNKE